MGAARADEIIGTVGDGRFLCATDNQGTLAADAPSGVAFVDLSTTHDLAFSGCNWWNCTAGGTLGDDWVWYINGAFPVNWLGYAFTPAAGANPYSYGAQTFVVSTKGYLQNSDPCPPNGTGATCGTDYNTQYSFPNSSGAVKSIISPLWDDLTYCPANANNTTLPPTSAVYVKQTVLGNGQHQTVVEWSGFGHWNATRTARMCGASDVVTFEIIWNSDTGTADLVYPTAYSLAAGAVDSGISIGGADINEIFGVNYRWIPMSGTSNGSALTLTANPAPLVSRLVECDGPVVALAPASAAINQGDKPTLSASATAYTTLAVNNTTWTWSTSAGTITPASGNPTSATLDTTGVSCQTGTITVTARVQDSAGRLGRQAGTAAFTMTDVAPTVTAISASPPPSEATVTTLTASFSDPGGTADVTLSGSYGYLWTFDDGTTSNLQNPTHKFMTAGPHPVTVAVTDRCGKTGTLTQNVTVGNLPPTLLTFSRPSTPSPAEGVALTFSASASDPGSDGPFVYGFDSGDAADPGHVVTVSAAVGATASIPYTYKRPGSFTASVTATDANGGVSAPLSLAVSVANVAPTATLSCGTGHVDVGYPIACTCTASDPGSSEETYAYVINWGDASAPTNAATGSHSYASPGSFTARAR